MKTLHILQSAQNIDQAFSMLVEPGDGVLLMGETNGLATEFFTEQLAGCNCYLLADDNVLANSRFKAVTVADWVELCVNYDRVISWSS